MAGSSCDRGIPYSLAQRSPGKIVDLTCVSHKLANRRYEGKKRSHSQVFISLAYQISMPVYVPYVLLLYQRYTPHEGHN